MAKAIPEGYHSITPYLVVNDKQHKLDVYSNSGEAVLKEMMASKE